MARYRGRHRAPSTTGRTLARSALVGAMASGPLLAAVPAAHAASTSTWDRVAQCESGGRWNVNTGNGYHGGLQFSPTTWKAFGGGDFASVAHKASRAEQIVVAERVLAKQGWGAWPTCSRKAGARGEPASQRSAPKKQPSATVEATAGGGGNYVVRRGDTLSEIATAHGISGGWRALAKKNPALDPDLLVPGQTLTV